MCENQVEKTMLVVMPILLTKMHINTLTHTHTHTMRGNHRFLGFIFYGSELITFKK